MKDAVLATAVVVGSAIGSVLWQAGSSSPDWSKAAERTFFEAWILATFVVLRYALYRRLK